MFTKPERARNMRPSVTSGFRTEASGKAMASVPSLISADVTIRGDLAGTGELHVDGEIIGDIAVDRLIIGETGSVEGAISAQTAEVRGRVHGSITARQVRLHATARLEGDIAHEQLTMDAGAQFLGRSLRYSGEGPALIASGEVIEMTAAE